MERLPGEVAQAAPPPLPPSSASAPPVRARSPLTEFGIDVLIAIVVIFAMSLIAGVLWGVVLGFELVAGGFDPADIAASIGEPGLLFQIGATLLSLGTAALVPLLWRRRPTVQDRARPHRAARLTKP